MEEIKLSEREMKFVALMEKTILQEECFELIRRLKPRGFFTAPASAKYHGNYEGGLFDHSYKMTLCLLALTQQLELKWQRPQSPYLVGMLHDLCKCDQYIRKDDGTYDYQKALVLTGHGDKSVIIAQRIVNLTDEEILCIRWHMGAYDDKSVWNNLNAAIEHYPNVLFTHTADMMASTICKI